MPHANTTIFCRLFNSASLSFNSSREIRLSTKRPIKVSATALGCSKISFNIKCAKPPFCAASASQVIAYSRGLSTVPAKSVIEIEVGVIVTTSSWPNSTARLVYSIKAATSEAMKFSPSPKPTTNGEFRRTPTITSGLSACTASKVNEPRKRFTASRIAAVKSPLCSFRKSLSKCATDSVSVSD